MRAPPRDTWPAIVVTATVDALALGAVFLAGGHADAASAALAASMFGIVTMVLSRSVFGERLSKERWSGVAVAFAAIG